jgi:hypothetical protein
MFLIEEWNPVSGLEIGSVDLDLLDDILIMTLSPSRLVSMREDEGSESIYGGDTISVSISYSSL